MTIIENNLPYIIIAGATLVIAVIYGIVKISTWAGEVSSDRAAFKEFMSEVRNDIKKILSRLGPGTVSGSSPKQLTELGKKVSESIGQKDFIEALARELHGQLSKESKYQIQTFCEEFVMDKYEPDADVQVRLEESAFDHGLDLYSVHMVVAVLLRDRIFELLACISHQVMR